MAGIESAVRRVRAGDDAVGATVVSSRRAHELDERRHGTRRLVLIGAIAWPSFAVADVAAALAAQQLRALPFLLGVRLFGAVFGVAGYLFLKSRKATSRQLTFVDTFLFVLSSALIAVQATKLGGLGSRLILGVMVVSFVRSALLPSHWRRALTVSGLSALTYPITLGIAAFFDASVRAQWSFESPVLGTFAMEMLFLLAGVVIGSLGSHLGWSARRQVFEARKLGNYRLKARIGGGGNGDVWLARQDPLGRDVALKVMKERGSRDEEAIKRFEREARAVSRLEHPNTIRIYEFGASDDGVLFIAMELLDGMDLDGLVETSGPLPPARALKLARQAAASLAEAHEKHIVHRDIKPANFFVTRSGNDWDFLKTLDFGVARVREGARGSTLTEEGILFGTPAYMAPEVCSGERADARSDVYALGAVVYFMLTGTPLFPHRTFTETIMSHVSRPPEPPSLRLGKALPRDLEDVVMRCLEKEPSQRFATARDLDDALARCSDDGKWTEDDAREFWLGMRASVQLRVKGAA